MRLQPGAMENGALSRLAVVLFRPKFSENVGSAARAMANMGARELVVVAPQDFDLGRAQALATAKGQEILEGMRVVEDLSQALAPFETVFGATARTGGWRKGLLSPEAAAVRTVPLLASGARVAVLFGPEDKGLTNGETKVCSRLVCIPTAQAASSLNLAQAVLVILYEFLKAATPGAARKRPAAREKALAARACRAEAASDAAGEQPVAGAAPGSRATTHQEREALFANVREMLLSIDFLKDDNPDYWMLPVRAFVDRIELKRSEFNLIMGLCRQVKWAVGRARK